MDKRFHHAFLTGILGVFMISRDLLGRKVDPVQVRLDEGVERLKVASLCSGDEPRLIKVRGIFLAMAASAVISEIYGHIPLLRTSKIQGPSATSLAAFALVVFGRLRQQPLVKCINLSDV
jgi:hypothetical protein